MTILDLLFFLILGFYFGDLIRKMFGAPEDKPNHMDAPNLRLRNAFYDKAEFSRLSRTDKILSTHLHIQTYIEPLTFWNYISWGLDSRFQTRYKLHLILAFLLAVALLVPANFPWIADVIVICWIYFLADFISYLQQRLKYVTIWDPEWMKHDCLRSGSIMED